METIGHKEIHFWWDGLVRIDEVKEYSDDRGSLVELWRDDDELMTQHGGENGLMGYITQPRMSYWSVTKPFVVRGPHQHEKQTDWFVTWKGRMVYQLFNPTTKEMKCYITDPSKITRVKVAPPIIHSYRNLESKDILTGNFPTELFMGQEKKEKIDEIRHEELVKPSKNIWILGANGRLGKALVEALYKDMEYHSYNVIPVFEKFSNDRDGLTKLNLVFDQILKSRVSENDLILNCIAKTNVQENSSEFVFPNFLLPKYITEFAVKNKIYMVHFSTDYVYQQGDVSEYTQSKILYEKWLDNSQEDRVMGEFERKDVVKYARVVRLANLFSQDKNDKLNALSKLYEKVKTTEQLTIPEGLTIMPTDVASVADFLSKNYIHNLNEFDQTINISGKPYEVEFLMESYASEYDLAVSYLKLPKIVNCPQVFLGSKNYKQLDCDEQIKKKFASLK